MAAPVGENRIRVFVLTGLRERLKAYGADLNPILHAAGLSSDTISDDFAWVSLEKFAHILTIAAKLTGDARFGLKYGAAGRFTTNPLGYLLSNAPDLRTGLRYFANYHQVLSSNRLDFVENAGRGHLEWSYAVTVRGTAQLTDFAVMRFISRIQAAAGEAWRPISVGLTRARPEAIAEYEALLGTKLSFNQAINTIALTSATLALPMPAPDPQLLQLVLRYCKEEVERQKAADNPLNRVREAITRCLERGNVGPKSVAEELGISMGSLHRRLKTEGSSFQRLFDDTRRRVAHRYLFESSLPLTDIAARLGYSELSAFSRAVRRWFGAPARTIRRRAANLDEAA